MKKKWFKKLLAVLISVICVFNLVACSSSDKTENAGTSQSDSGNRTTPTEESKAEDVNLYGYVEPVNLKIGLSFNSDFEWAPGESVDNNTWWNLYKEQGFNLEVMYNVDGTQAETKRTTAIASGDYPDLMNVSGADLVKYAETGVIADLSEIFDKYASDELKEYVAYGDGTSLNSAKVNGALYGIPKVEDNHGNAMMMFIRQDWLDNLNLKMPTTMDELKAVAKAFTQQDPDGNGQADTYGMALNGKDGFTYWSGMQAFFEGYGAAPGFWNGQFTFIQKDGKVIWGGALANEMKTGLMDLKEMYENGSLAKNFGTMDYNQITQDVGAGKCGIYFAPRWGAMVPAVDALKSDLNAHIVSAKIPDGFGSGSSKAYVPTTPTSYFVISNKYKNPEALIKLLNLSVQKLVYPADTNEYDMYTGKAGVYSGWKACLTATTSPDAPITDVAKEYEAITSGNKDGLTPSQLADVEAMESYTSAVKDGTLKDKLAVDDPNVSLGIGLWTVTGDKLGGGLTMNKMIDEGNFNYSAYNYVPTSTMSSKFSTLDKLALETIVKIISGDNVESYDKFLKSWEALGGTDVTKEAQEWYEQNNK